MPQANVQKFIKRIMVDPELRSRLNAAPDRAGREAILAEENLDFTDHEFSEGVRAMHVTLQFQEDYAKLSDIENWWNFLNSQG
jgi:hypothetical protein